MKKFLAAAAFLLTASLMAQPSNPTVVLVSTAPTLGSACSGNLPVRLVVTTGQSWTCSNKQWFPSQANAAVLHLTGQTSSIGTSTAFTNSTGGTLLVRAACVTHTTTAGSAGTVTCSTLTPDSFSLTSSTTDLTSLASSRSNNAGNIMVLRNNDTLRYSTTVASASGSPQYELIIEFEIMGQ